MRFGSVAVVVLTLCFSLPASARPLPQEAAAVAAPAPSLSDAQIVQFLENAKVVKTKSIGKGVTGAIRATLSDGTLTHDAQIQKVDEKRDVFQPFLFAGLMLLVIEAALSTRRRRRYPEEH